MAAAIMTRSAKLRLGIAVTLLLVTTVPTGLRAANTADLDPGEARPPAGDIGPADLAAPPAQHAAIPQESRGNPLWAIPLSSLTATRERPLFTPGRRPPKPPSTPPPVIVVAPPPRQPTTQPPRLTLVGTVIGVGDRIAVFFDGTTRQLVRLRAGEAREGWTLRSIHPRKVVFEKGTIAQTFSLPIPTNDGRVTVH
jgi:general secretion pathway protein N